MRNLDFEKPWIRTAVLIEIPIVIYLFLIWSPPTIEQGFWASKNVCTETKAGRIMTQKPVSRGAWREEASWMWWLFSIQKGRYWGHPLPIPVQVRENIIFQVPVGTYKHLWDKRSQQTRSVSERSREGAFHQRQGSLGVDWLSLHFVFFSAFSSPYRHSL